MASTLDDDYVRRTALWIRTNEPRLAGVRAPRPNAMNPLSWVGSPQTPAVLALTRAQLSYLLTRIEGIGISVGCMDIPIENPRPSQLLPKDTSDAQSIASFVSNLSLFPSAWWSTPAPIDGELRYIYSSFTKLPSLHLTNPPSHEPDKHAIPLDAFKNLQALHLEDIDPRSLLGWDRLAEGLRSLTVRRSGIEDVTHLVVDAVTEDENRRKSGDLAPIQRKAARRNSQQRSRHPSWHSSFRGIPAIQEESEEPSPPSSSSSDSAPALPKLSPAKWWALRHLCLADNGLTFFSADVIPYLTSVTNLDLSNNLLVSVPAGLGELHRLTSLNLAGNMIESVLGIYTMLGQVLTLNLGSNRLDSLCGLERLGGLQRIDLRNNRIEESGEVGRLAALPDISEVWVTGNPLTTREPDWRVNCFSHFSKEQKEVMLDGAPAGYLERGRIDVIVGTPKMEPVTVVASPRAPVLSTTHTRVNSAAGGTVPSPLPNGVVSPPNGSSELTGVASASVSPSLGATSSAPSYVATVHAHPKSRRRKQPRIVDLDEDDVPGPGHNSSRDRSPISQTRQVRDQKDKSVSSPHPIAVGEISANVPKGDVQSAEPTASARTVIPPGAATDVNASLAPPQPTATIPNKAHASATLGRHSLRAPTAGSESDAHEVEPVGALPIPLALPAGFNGRTRRSPSSSATMSASTGPNGRRSKRRARVSASVYEPSASTISGSPPSVSPSPRKANTMKPPDALAELQFASEADAFRAKIEALRNEVGDSWLKVLSQSNNLGNSPPNRAG